MKTPRMMLHILTRFLPNKEKPSMRERAAMELPSIFMFRKYMRAKMCIRDSDNIVHIVI